MLNWDGQLTFVPPMIFGVAVLAIFAAIVALDMLRPSGRETLEKRFYLSIGVGIVSNVLWLLALAVGLL